MRKLYIRKHQGPAIPTCQIMAIANRQVAYVIFAVAQIQHWGYHNQRHP